MRIVCAALVLAGCGKELHHGVDAGPPDVAVDTLVSSMGDAPPGTVQLKVTLGTAAVPNVAVFFQDGSSQLIEDKLTNESGVAWAAMPSGGYVTALEHVGDGVDELTTFAGVKSGDLLVLAHADPGQRKAWPFNLSFQPATGATTYEVRTSCSDEAFGVTNPQPMPTDPQNSMTLFGCDDGVADFAITAFDLNGDPTGSMLYAEGVVLPVPPASSVDPSQYPALALVPAFDTVSAHSASYTNVPDFYSSLGVYQAVTATRRSYDASAGIEVTGTSISGQLSKVFPTNGPTTMLTVTTGYPKVTYDADGVPHSSSLSQYLFYDWGPMTETYMLDAGSAYVPGYNSKPAYDAATRAISWTEGPAPLPAQLVRAHIHVYRDDVPAGRSWGWRIVAPHDAASVTYPQLPVLGFDFTPSATDATTIDEVTTANVPGGYDGWRPHGFSDFARAVTGSSGKMSVQLLYSPEL